MRFVKCVMGVINPCGRISALFITLKETSGERDETVCSYRQLLIKLRAL